MNPPVKYVAELKHVREVSLLGTADLAFWRDRLENEDLRPAERDGRARVLVIAADGRFAGLRFREVSFSVLLARPDAEAGSGEGTRHDGAYLLHAFNSNRFFAWSERAFFSTPYSHGRVSVTASPAASIEVARGSKVVFAARRRAESADAGRGEDCWDGPVFLPTRGRGARRLFHARIAGAARTYPFRLGEDELTLGPAPGGALQALVDSGFVPVEWLVRKDATHAKSKTVKRGDVWQS